MTGIYEITPFRQVSPAAEQIRVSVQGGRTQLDLALPLDIPVASLVPELVNLVRSRDGEHGDDASAVGTRHTFWVLHRLDPQVALAPDATLRTAGAVNGELLLLTPERALSAPTLYDDVVDAAARLNRAAYAGWGPAAARWMAFVGLALASLVWVYFLTDTALRGNRATMVGLAAVTVAALVGGAALSHRAYGQTVAGAALGWATVPISTAIVWALLHGFGGYGLAIGCVVMLALIATCCWAIGTGRWGYLASGVIFAVGGAALGSHALGVDARTVGTVLAVAAVLGCLTVPRLTAGLRHVRHPTAQADDATTNPFPPHAAGENSGAGTATTVPMPTAEEVWAGVRSATFNRSALLAGLAVCVVCGAATVLHAEASVRWAELAFTVVCAATLGLYARRLSSVWERTSLGVPCAALLVVACERAQDGTPAMQWAGFIAPLIVAVVAAVRGLRMSGGALPRHYTTALAYAEYAAVAALIPVALWADGFFAWLEMR